MNIENETAHVTKVPGYNLRDDFIRKYARDLRRVSTLKGIKNFITKWRHLYGLHESSKYLFEGDYDPKETLECVIANRRPGGPFCKHMQSIEVYKEGHKKCGSHVLAPMIGIEVLRLAKHFVVPDFVALHQGFCADPKHRDCF